MRREDSDDRVVWFSGRRAASMQQGRWSDDGRQCGNAGSRLENQSQEFGSEGKSEKNEVQSEILAYQEEQSLPEELHEGGVKKLLRAGMVPARTWGAHAAGMAPTERLKLRRQMAAAAGKKGMTSLSLFMAAFRLAAEEELSTMATQYWTRTMDREMVSRSERSFHEADSRGSHVETGKRTSRRSDVCNP